MKVKNSRHIRNRIIYTLVIAILLCATIFSMIAYTYRQAEQSAFENLHMRTKEIKDSIALQMLSDRENLYTIANIAANLNSEGKSYDVLFQSFKSIGLINAIGIYSSDGVFSTGYGSIDVSDKMSFEEEAKKAPYISGIVEDVTHSGRKIIRSSVPIKSQGETIGILYGLIELNNLKKQYKPMADNSEARLYIIERGNGNFIVDTWRDNLGNLNDARVIESKKGYSYEDMKQDIFSGKNGFCAYRSNISHTMMYSHYSPIEIGDWHIVLSVPESLVLAQAKEVRSNLWSVFAAVVLIMILYLVLIFGSEKKNSDIAQYASAIRKLLLGINQEHNSVNEALEKVCEFSKSHSAFFADIEGENHNYVVSSQKDKLLISADERKYLISHIFELSDNFINGSNITLLIREISCDYRLSKTNSEFYNFMKTHKIKFISFAAITDKNGHISVLGVINPKKRYEAKEILKDIAVCFSISIYNKKYLDKTELDAVTDALTGISNRVAYKRYVEQLDQKASSDFACVYIDVNELHVYNNKYGHAAGDEMLLCIANILKEVFYGEHIYRMGGDEYLVFVENTTKEKVEKSIEHLIEKSEERGYHISVGMNFTVKNVDTDSLVREAEKRMYDAKARYYQNKEKKSIVNTDERKFKFIETGIQDLDMMIKVLSGHYSGIYSVSLETDTARRIIMPSYLDFSESEENFSQILKDYINNTVHPDFHRGILKFLNYSVLKEQLANNEVPSYTYKKNNGESVVLSVYAQGENTLWVFENA